MPTFANCNHKFIIKTIKMEELLKQINNLMRQSLVKREQSRLRGEQFNMFSACGVNHYETTHSSILAELLNPNGSHGQDILFLEKFIALLHSDLDFKLDKSASVIREQYTGDGYIDILITNPYNQAIIIENKIYAEDQYQQLIRYNNYAHNEFGEGNYVIFYLTLYGTVASQQSAENLNYTTISYARTITEWLEDCIKMCVRLPMIRETLIQYKNHILSLTNQDMDNEDKNRMLELVSSHAEDVEKILNSEYDLLQYVFNTRVVKILKEQASARGLLFETQNMFLSVRGGRGFYFYRPEWKHLAIYFWSEKMSEREFHCGISNYNSVEMTSLTRQKLNCLDNEPTEGWPYGWSWLSDNYFNWNIRTALDMANSTDNRFCKYIIDKLDKMLKEIDEKHLVML